MGTKLNCDIGIVSYNSIPELNACINSLLKYEKKLINQIIIVENGGLNIEQLKSIFPDSWQKYSIIRPKKNIGFSKACNLIIKRADAAYLCLINPDTIVKEAFLKKALQFFKQHKDVGIIGPRIIEPSGKIQGSARKFPSIATAFFGRSSLFTRFFPNNSFSRKNVIIKDSPIEVDWVSGACMIIRKDAISDVGYLDEKFFMYWEDCDWCRRFWDNGWRVIYNPELGPIEHGTGTSSNRSKIKCHYWFHKSAIRLYMKYDKSPLKIGSLLSIIGGFFRFFLLLPKVVI